MIEQFLGSSPAEGSAYASSSEERREQFEIYEKALLEIRDSYYATRALPVKIATEALASASKQIIGRTDSPFKRPCPNCGNERWAWLAGDRDACEWTHCNACKPASRPA